MDKKIIKCVLLTISFFVVLLLYDYLKFVSSEEENITGFYENIQFSRNIFLSFVGLLAYLFRVGLNNKDKQ